jgi:hypothetical protein
MVVPYSWGGGWGLDQFAQYLAFRDFRIQQVVATDMVYHFGGKWGHSLGISQVLAYLPWWKIERPENVDRLDWFIQGRKRDWRRDWRWSRRSTWLRGHEVVDSQGRIAGNRNAVVLATHGNMDDVRLFRECVFKRADELFLQKVA